MSDGFGQTALNKLPQGLLGFFDIKNGGRYPQSLAQQLQGTADLLAWYANTNRVYFRTGLNIAVLGQTTFFTVPDGEYWYVLHASFVTSVLGAGQTLEGVISFTDAAGIRNILLSENPGARTAGAVYQTQARDFWGGPGDTIGFYATQLAAGPIVAPIMSIAVARLPV